MVKNNSLSADKKNKSNLFKKKLKSIVDRLPKKTGVYQMKNKDGETIYVGKAKDLKSRLKGHFFNANPSLRAQKMLEQIENVEFTEVSNDVEALVLESNLIKELQPKFNVLLRDDKSFLFIRVSVNEDFPQITLIRRPTKDGAKYFGPKTKSGAAKKTIELLQKIFKFRVCTYEITQSQNGEINIKKSGSAKLPCLEAHIGKCEAPCVGKISKEEYREKINAAVKFLKGDTSEIKKQLIGKMQSSALKKDFEQAAKWRDIMQAIDNFSEKQIAQEPSDFEADIIGAVEKFDKAFFHLFQMRDGRIIGSEDFVFPLGENLSESLLAFLREHAERIIDLPKTIILDLGVFSENVKDEWEKYFERISGSKVEILLPKIGKRKDLLDLAKKNAENYANKNAPQFIKHSSNTEELKSALRELKEKMNLPNEPLRIETYDISHLSGTETVGSMVVFHKGEPRRPHYRKFKIRTLKEGVIDDFGAIREVIFRRFKNQPRPLPEKFKLRKAVKSDFDYIKKQIEKENLNSENLDYKQFLVLKKNGDIVGFAREKVYKDENAHLIASLYIAPEFRGNNYSQFLIRRVMEKSKSKKFYAIVFGKERFVNYLNRLGFEYLKTIPNVLIKRVKRAEKEQKKELMSKTFFLVFIKRKQDESFEAMPDLLVIDGGKGQLGAAVKALSEFRSIEKRIPLCALAKKEEEVFMQDVNQPLAISKNSPAGLLLQRMRDEAHRFALAFNQDLRNKKISQSILDEISGIGSTTKEKLLQEFGSISGIKNASDEEIRKLVGQNILELLRENL